MRYENIKKGVFVDRPNRFIAHVEIDGRRETVHVKNTGRCKELLRAGTSVYAEECGNPGRKTKWDLIAVEKGERMVNIDSQAPNKLVKERLEKGNLFKNIICIKPEFTYGNSRIDLYVEADGKKILIEVKGVTLEENNVVRFPDAPSERAVKHVEELMRAAADGFEAYVFFVVQLEGADKFMPNMDTHPEFGEALRKARHAGVKAVAYDCAVAADSIEIRSEVPIVLEDSGFRELAEPLIAWYRQNKRDLPWRATADPYRIWVSEIMLQQTRVEAVKPYYERFLSELPGVRELADVPEERLLKLWEGLGYYNRARNMQKAARQIVEDYGGRFPVTYEEIRNLKGIGNYTAGAIASFAYGILKPAVDGNVLRVLSRVQKSYEDIMKQSVRKSFEEQVRAVIPKVRAGDFNQSLIELGAIVCVPNGAPKCEECPLKELCRAHADGVELELPKKTPPKKRRVEDRTVLVLLSDNKAALKKRPSKGLLAGLYELPNLEGRYESQEILSYVKELGLSPIRIQSLPEAKHIFSHIEWHMAGYAVKIEEPDKEPEGFFFVEKAQMEDIYSIPAAFGAYTEYFKHRF